MLTRANLDINFFPYALYHSIQISNYFPEPNTITSHVDKDTSKQDNLFPLWSFVCHAYVRPPGKRKSKLKNHVSKEIFLLYDPHTNRKFLYCNGDNHMIKLTSHVQFY